MSSENGCCESVFRVFARKRPLFSLFFLFFGLSRICRGFSPKSGFSSKRSPFSPRSGQGVVLGAKTAHFLQPRECNASKTRHHRHIANALSLCRLFQVTLVSPLMSLGHHGSENDMISLARASGTTWAPISFSSHILSPNVQNIVLSTTVWNRLSCTLVIFHIKSCSTGPCWLEIVK